MFKMELKWGKEQLQNPNSLTCVRKIRFQYDLPAKKTILNTNSSFQIACKKALGLMTSRSLLRIL